MEHVAGYASLMRDEASSVGKEVAKRAIAWGVTLFALLVFLILAGVAAMLAAVQDQFHWAFLLVPALALAIAGVGFDAAVWELWPYLTAGAEIHMPEPSVRTDPEALRDGAYAAGVAVRGPPRSVAGRAGAVS